MNDYAEDKERRCREIESYISNIPEILIYFIPGFISISVFKMVTRAKIEWSAKIILSLVLSYVWLAIGEVLITAFGANVDNVFIQGGISICIGIFFSWLWICLSRQRWFKEFTVEHFNFSPAPTAWEDVLYLEEGTMIRVKYKNSSQAITGILESIGHVPDDPWIAIEYYNFYPDISDDWHTERQDEYHHLLVNINDIEYAEIWPNVDRS